MITLTDEQAGELRQLAGRVRNFLTTVESADAGARAVRDDLIDHCENLRRILLEKLVVKEDEPARTIDDELPRPNQADREVYPDLMSDEEIDDQERVENREAMLAARARVGERAGAANVTEVYREVLERIRDYADNSVANGTWSGQDAMNLFNLADDGLRAAQDLPVNVLP